MEKWRVIGNGDNKGWPKSESTSGEDGLMGVCQKQQEKEEKKLNKRRKRRWIIGTWLKLGDKDDRRKNKTSDEELRK